MSTRTRIRRTLALALAGGTLAVGVPAAIAAGGGSDAGSTDSGAPSTRLVQEEQQPGDQSRPDHDCPERDGNGGNGGNGSDGNGGGSSDSGAGATPTPAV